MGTGTGDRLLARVRLPRGDDSPRAEDLFLERSKTRRPSERVRHPGHWADPGPGRASREVGMLALIRSTYVSQGPLESDCHVQRFCLAVPARHSGHDVEPRASTRVTHHRMTWCTSIVRLRTSLIWVRPTSSLRTAGRPARTALAARSSTRCAH